MVPDPDAALLVAFQRGDRSAFGTLFERHGRAMVAFCHRFVKDASRAEDLAQDVFLKLHQAAPSYRPTARFRTFLYRIAANHCLNELRRGERASRAAPGLDGAPEDLDRLAGSGATPEESARGRALARAVEGMLERLPAKQRLAFVLCRFEGMSYGEIAAVLGTSVPAVKSLVHRATVAAAEALAPFAGGEAA